ATIDRAPAGDDAVARDLGLLHAELARAMLDEHVELFERALVHEKLDALARGELAALVLRLDARLAAAFAGTRAARFKLVDDVFHGSARPESRSAMHSTPSRVIREPREARQQPGFLAQAARKPG